MLSDHVKQILKAFVNGTHRLTILTGSGISAESNIPTFRGPEGFWSIGSKEYKPHELATYKTFLKDPDEVWKWYLYRRGVCRKAKPNPGHLAIVEMERLFPDRFSLITQNVDGLHLRAGNSLKNTYEIHGNVSYMRCGQECNPAIVPIPEEIANKAKGEDLTEKERQLLRCPSCGHPARPHVLWFDETYNEEYYHYLSALKLASQTRLLLVVGTSGSTNLPVLVAQKMLRRNGILIDINIEEDPFSIMAEKSGGEFIQETSARALPAVLKVFSEAVRKA
ncbi:MAG: RNA polymerase subunit sigma [Deltaproteobacteria bacterium]|nr:RNA polymerase subunit sigma [Deltaproteobacteria bacterium]